MAHTLTVTAPTDTELCITRRFDAPRPIVYDCWTKPELVAAGFDRLEAVLTTLA